MVFDSKQMASKFLDGDLNSKDEIDQLIAQSEANMAYPVEFATNSLRTDYIVFEAIIFPGINFFWVGSIMMMIGLTMSWIRRRFQLKR